ncbi:hypothetical protein [Mucilaginibacter sp. NFX135]|uniref:hypothetical protein n=1 Tax=Mucilaginibacter sp. NFX135 TaxID=3402687 RepID=UPI003AFA6217
MKPLYLILLAGLLTGYSSYAQNSFPTSGNVGIGATSPSSLLTVGGNFSSGGSHQVSIVSAPTAATGLLTGVASQLTANSSAISDGTYYAFLGQVGTLNTPSNLTSTVGLIAFGGNVIHRGTGTVTGAASLVAGGVSATNGGTVTNGYGVYISPVKGTGVTNGYGVYQTAIGDNNYFAGNIGIGTTTPATQLHLATTAGPVLTLDKTGVQAWRLDVSQNSDFRLWNASVGTAPLTVQASGNVGIGTTTPKEALSVNGNIRSKQVTVESANWPDYVFKKDYQLPSLQDVKAYIDQNQHLPEIPSEQQIAKEGLNLGEMNKLLMKKVEELTLYLIEKDKSIEELKSSLTMQQKQIEEIKKLISARH